MKINYLYSALICTFVAFTGCSDDVFEEPKEIWHEGDEIVFGARAGYEPDQKASRTIYTGKQFTHNKKTYEVVQWVEGDNVSIYSPEAKVIGDKFFADYVVKSRHSSGSAEDNCDYAVLAPKDINNALQWGSANDHTFYACYPTEKTTTYNGKVGIQISPLADNDPNGIHVRGRVPNNQIPLDIVKTTENGKTVYTAKPVMRNAHMLALGKANKTDQKVDLTFQSICTVLDLELTGANKAVTITGILINSESSRVAGEYECDLRYQDLTKPFVYPACNVPKDFQGEARNPIMVPLMKDFGKGSLGLIVDAKTSVRLKVFLAPTTNFNDLSLTIITPQGRKTHQFNATKPGSNVAENITFKAHLKYNLSNIKLPTSFSSKNWMSRIDGNTLISQLSIPGTSNSFSDGYTGADANYKKSQEKSIKVQWEDFGIRCFEIRCDRNLLGTWGDLGNRQILAGSGESLGVKVKDALVAIWDELAANPSEFAMVIMNYQPSGKTRDGGAFLGEFSNFYYNDLQKELNDLATHKSFVLEKNTIKYDPTKTLEECRGKLLFVVRPSSFGEGVLGETFIKSQNDRPYLIVDGWGSLQDQWYQRGYDVDITERGTGGKIGLNSNAANVHFVGSMEQSMMSTDPSAVITPKQRGNVRRFNYITNLNNVTVWAQDWNRVCSVSNKYTMDFSWPLKTYYVQWNESYKEKLANAKETFEKAISSDTERTIFFNCISGYYIHQATDSYRAASDQGTGGSFGDIATYSRDINKAFYEYMLTQWNARITAPMGIVIMNRVGSGTLVDNPENYYMPNIVISNNFSFPLKTRDGSAQK